jgi:hypothetical protein
MLKIGWRSDPSETQAGEESTMNTIRAVYEDGVFRPLEPVSLPDRSTVEFEPRTIAEFEPGPVAPWVTTPDFSEGARDRAKLDAIYEVLSHRYSTGESDIAERHNEHQP